MTSPHIDSYIKDEDEIEKKGIERQLREGEHITSKMSETHESMEGYHEPGLYEIRIRGHLDDRRAAWFDSLTLRREDSGDTLLTGWVLDQAALYGLLRKVRDLGMPLISVNFLRAGNTSE